MKMGKRTKKNAKADAKAKRSRRVTPMMVGDQMKAARLQDTKARIAYARWGRS